MLKLTAFVVSVLAATEATASLAPWLPVAVAVVPAVDGWFMDDYEGRNLDGSLRCYQCDTDSEGPENDTHARLCSLQNWKHANVSQKRDMIMQCPRRKSAFCHLVVREGDPGYAARGCQGPRYEKTSAEAHVGCFYMDMKPPLRRACLCDSLLCNGRPPARPLDNILLLLTIGVNPTLWLMFSLNYF